MWTMQFLLGVDTTIHVGLGGGFWLRAGVGALVLFGLLGLLDGVLKRAMRPPNARDGRGRPTSPSSSA